MSSLLGLVRWIIRWRWLVVLASLLLLFVVYARANSLEGAIRKQYVASGNGSIDLSAAVPQKGWERVCILGPYSTTADTSALLGFEWNSDGHSSVRTDDDVTLLVFANDTMVIAATDYPRAGPDFSSLASRCYPRSASRFTLG